MSTLRKLKAYVLGGDSDQSAELKAADIPVSDADCRTCGIPCDAGHDEYPSRFDVDMESQMLGSVKPYHRQLVISTGKSDWEKEVTEADGTLAFYLDAAHGDAPKKGKKPPPSGSENAVPGVYDSSATRKVTILNGSHNTVCEDPMQDTVLVFPDYKVVTEVMCSEEGAKQLWKSLERDGPAPAEGSQVKTWVLPYNCVITICSHKRRDNRCGIAAPKLAHTFQESLERAGWEVHTQLEDPSFSSTAFEDTPGTPAEKDTEFRRRLEAVDSADQKRMLIIRNSHMGGHKFAGNVIINTPQGSCVWYGRVTPHEVDAIVKETVIGGKILPPLLRGGINLSRPGAATLHDW
ncbi:uncharacterized protein LAESUDRAFT_808148 [Laetiporus sulphureus 93-53]|uniref:Sucraseferredoxin-like protein n=1 Tax=Laetiporus sulphureus 93-53 TaxID=1314785 RepID=A0A165I3P2_9APHY|nr:uncharacterized protein LAESUDRAFT_808148 [Laetiporus sulphureus 93-53]KZT12554.1 hypothetical protein LAESUDRAFT_808148 [Laetiporus sulphureus 93-53]